MIWWYRIVLENMESIEFLKRCVHQIVKDIAIRNGVTNYAELEQLFPKRLVAPKRGAANLVYDKSMLNGDKYKKNPIKIGADEYWILAEPHAWRGRHKDDIIKHMKSHPEWFLRQDIMDMEAALTQLSTINKKTKISTLQSSAAMGQIQLSSVGQVSTKGHTVGYYYDYWDDFFKEWKKGKSHGNVSNADKIKGWSNPDSNECSLFNNIDTSDKASEYVPEPWWGNDGTAPLHSVVINLNPGQGGEEQLLSAVFGFSTYADLVNSNHLKETINWHFTERASPLFAALDKISLTDVWSRNLNVSNHLSIELIPWHTKQASGIGYAKQYNAYIKQNLREIFDYCISFAAVASRNIANNKLKNTVIIRASYRRIEPLLLKLKKAEITGYKEMPKVLTLNGSNSKYQVFELNAFKDIKFVCVWDPKRRNKLPCVPDLQSIITNI